MQKKTLSVALMAALSVVAQGQASETLPDVQVSATIPSETAALIKPDPQRTDVSNMRDISRYGIGVSVGGVGDRRGNAGVEIRGIGGNRIDMELDGLALPDGMTWGHEALTYGRDFIDPDSLRAVKVDPTAGGNLGGQVNFETWRIDDFVNRDRRYYFGFKPSYQSRNKTWGATLTGAAHTDLGALMAIYTHRDGHEMKTRGDVGGKGLMRTRNNPQDINSDSLLLKGKVGDHNRALELTVDFFRRQTKTQRYAMEGVNPVTKQQVLSSNSNDRVLRHRQSLTYTQKTDLPWLINDLSATVYHQALRWRDHEDAMMNYGGQPMTQLERNKFKQNLAGLALRVGADIDETAIKQALTLNMSYDHKTAERPQLQMMGNMPAVTIKNHPDSTTHKLALNLSDKMMFTDQITLTPALGVQYYKIKAHADEAYLRTKPSPWLPNYDEVNFLPSLKLAYQFNPATEAYVSYARGVNNPPFDSMASLNHVPRAPWTKMQFLPNPDLKSETGDRYEIGARVQSGDVAFSAAAYTHRYKNFIQLFGKPISARPPELVMMTNNIDEVNTWGAEINALWQINDAWHISGGLAWMDGKQKDQGKKTTFVNVQPLKAVLGVGYQTEQWQADSHVVITGKQPKVDPEYFRAPSWATWDMQFAYTPNKNLRFDVGVYNITNEKYWLASDVAMLNQAGFGKSVNDLYTQPGRNIALGFSMNF